MFINKNLKLQYKPTFATVSINYEITKARSHQHILNLYKCSINYLNLIQNGHTFEKRFNQNNYIVFVISIFEYLTAAVNKLQP